MTNLVPGQKLYQCPIFLSTVAKFLYESFITRYGYFTTLKTDGGPEFCNQVIATLVETYGIKHILGTPHYPQSHGFIERQHQGIINFSKITKHQPLYHPPIHRPLGRSHTSQIHDWTHTTVSSSWFYGSFPTSVLYSVPVPQLQLLQDELFAFRFDQLRQRLHNHLSAEHMTAYQRQQQKLSSISKLAEQIHYNSTIWSYFGISLFKS